MKLFTFITLVVCSVHQITFAQTQNPALQIKHTNKWYFGRTQLGNPNTAPSLHFDNGSPYVMTVGRGGGFSTICDSTGSLEIYGGGFSLTNNVHAVIKNGNGIIGDTVNTIQNSLAVPMPENPDLIYYFTVPLSLKYNLVDMSLDSGKGEIIKKNVTIYPNPPGAGAKIGAVHHCNGSDIWVVVHQLYTDKFIAFLVTDTGITSTPVISQAGPMDNEQGFESQGGLLKFSPNGKKVAMTSNGFFTSPHLFDFDNSTGIITNPVPLQKDTGEQGISFSPDNSLLYIGTVNGRLLQYNLNVPDIAASRKLIFEGRAIASFGGIQLGSDGRIYVSPANSYYLGVINHPNALDTLCDFSFEGIYLNGSQAHRGLMNTVESYFYTGSSAYPCYGDTNVSNTSLHSGSTSQLSVRAYPNPFSDYTLIEIQFVHSAGGKLNYQLFDALGREYDAFIYESNTEGNVVQAIVRRNKLKSGIYFLTVTNSDRNNATLKLSIF